MVTQSHLEAVLLLHDDAADNVDYAGHEREDDDHREEVGAHFDDLCLIRRKGESLQLKRCLRLDKTF